MIMEPPLPDINRDDCTGCALCVEVCPENALAIENDVVTIIEGIDCEYCGECESVCPTEAITCPYDIVLTQNAC